MLLYQSNIILDKIIIQGHARSCRSSKGYNANEYIEGFKKDNNMNKDKHEFELPVAIYMQPVQDVIVGLPCMCRDLARRIHAFGGASSKNS